MARAGHHDERVRRQPALRASLGGSAGCRRTDGLHGGRRVPVRAHHAVEHVRGRPRNMGVAVTVGKGKADVAEEEAGQQERDEVGGQDHGGRHPGHVHISVAVHGLLEAAAQS